MAEKLSGVTIDDFFQRDNIDQDRVERMIYTRRYNDCMHKMKDSKKNGNTFCIYKVQEYDLDPGYNFMDCVKFIVSKLTDAGFTQTRYVPPNFIRISWINEEIEKKKINNLHKLYEEALKPEPNVIKAPPIMWFGSRTRHDEEVELLLDKSNQLPIASRREPRPGLRPGPVKRLGGI